ncbi:putative membrane protein YkoI [Sinorhizobium fredii]|uniref:PepSY domain-containing protein n=1 Tax=Sinorhizobium fredii (strain USDA 257) TaxID=1185652 RepID=I3X433_SINF2|nr:PepSY domain-containing protein [Sinorhizobium fredii]AFL50639.1 hypothetical protein USDA257_c20560 [Sinorhizobium fredii USDA 257]
MLRPPQYNTSAPSIAGADGDRRIQNRKTLAKHSTGATLIIFCGSILNRNMEFKMSNMSLLSVAFAASVATASVACGIASVNPAAAAEHLPGTDDATEYARLSSSKLRLADAIAAAEKKFGGKAVDAALDDEQQIATFEVELMTATGSKEVSVDGQTGEVKEVTDAGGREAGNGSSDDE